MELVIYPPKKSFYEVLADPFGRTSDGMGAVRALLGLGDRRGLRP